MAAPPASVQERFAERRERNVKRAAAALLVVAALAGAAGCGDDERADDRTEAAPAAAAPQENPEQTIGGDEEGSAEPPATDRSSPDDRRVESDLRRALQQGDSAGDIVGVDLSRTSITVRTSLAGGRGDAEEGSSLCAQVRRFLAQRPARSTVGTVTVAGRAGAVITRC